jgi:RNA polymerase sigma-70 factor, ECF subfamily
VLRSDRALLDAFRRGDPAALSKVYWEYVDAVAAVARHGFIVDASGRVRGEPAPADQRDVVQEVFARAFSDKARRAYDGINPYRPYLLRICKNLMIDRARARSRVVALEEQDRSGRPIDEWLADDTLPDEPNLDTDPEWRALVALTESFVRTLDDEARQFVKLRYEEQKSQYEVADLMKVTRRRVRTLEARVEKGLRRAMAAKGQRAPEALVLLLALASSLWS